MIDNGSGALIGQNSIEYIDTLIGIWNKEDGAVLMDWQIPSETAFYMMREAEQQSVLGKNL